MTPLLLLLILWPHFKAIKLDVFFSYVKNEQAANKKWKKLTGSEWFSEYEDGYEVTFFPSYIFIYLAFISFWLLVGLVVFHCIKVILLIISFFQISYTGVGKTQLNFLRLLSEKATQTFDLTCKGSQGCFDSKSNALEKAIRLQGANDGILSYMKNDPTVKITKVWADSYDKYEDDTDLAKS